MEEEFREVKDRLFKIAEKLRKKGVGNEVYFTMFINDAESAIKFAEVCNPKYLEKYAEAESDAWSLLRDIKEAKEEKKISLEEHAEAYNTIVGMWKATKGLITNKLKEKCMCKWRD